ncbi:uncharacterized protein LOC115750842 isoform X2 [Rhodamnia argentea]|uniref:Uncharacterized protein LOC115750842 isoform X2 n=1 Tax=Rhodamnia argentea TaxID=178133 RepID=A0A8B8QB12_9MYRT|nr:uncharacterized protein LOC115750842 isoform X2 [Rhodamnia argentea]
MLRKPFHGWRRIKQEIQKLTAFRAPSPYLNPVREWPSSATNPTPLISVSPLPPQSHFRFTHHESLSTSCLATGPSAAAYYSRAPVPDPNTHFEDPILDVKSPIESSDDQRENGGDGEGFGRRRTLPGERVLLFTCVSGDDGKCSVYVVETKHNSQVRSLIICPHDLVTLESLKQNPEVVNKLEVYPGDMYDVAKEQLMKYGGQVMPLKEQVANMLEVYLGCGFRVSYEKAMEYGYGFMVHHFPLQVALCSEKQLSTKISLIEASLMFETTDILVGPWKRRAVPSRCSCLWRLCLLHLLKWIQSGIYVGWKK